jgi:hypothetical protein
VLPQADIKGLTINSRGRVDDKNISDLSRADIAAAWNRTAVEDLWRENVRLDFRPLTFVSPSLLAPAVYFYHALTHPLPVSLVCGIPYSRSTCHGAWAAY